MVDTGHLIIVVGKIERGVDPKSVGCGRSENISVKLQLYTCVACLAIVDVHAAPSCCRVDIGEGQQVRRILDIIVEATADSVVEKREVGTKVPTDCFLPTQLVIGWRIESGIFITCYLAHGDGSSQIGRHIGVDISCYAITGTELEHVYPLQRFHPMLILHIPTGTHRPEGTSSVFRIGTKEVCLIDAVAHLGSIAAVVGVVGIEVIRVEPVQNIACRKVAFRGCAAHQTIVGTEVRSRQTL